MGKKKGTTYLIIKSRSNSLPRFDMDLMMRCGSKDSSICTVMTAYILWEKINDFIEGQIMDDGSLVEWAKEDSKENKKELKRMVCYLIFYLFVYDLVLH